MTTGKKLGFASIVLFVMADLLLGTANGVFSIVAWFLSLVTGILAAQRSSKWWLVTPALNLLFAGLMIWVAFHAV